MRALLVVIIATTAACSSDIRRPASAQLSLTGTIYASGLERRGDVIGGATVTLLDVATGQPLATNATSEAGGYRLTTAVTASQRVVLVVQATGFAPAVRAFTVSPYTEVAASLSLQPLRALDCSEQTCAAPGEDVWWEAPPPTASGQAQASAFDAVSLEVGDDAPGVLALAWVTLDAGVDEDGGVPESPGEVALRVPLAQWPRLLDATPDSGVLEAPLARLDVRTGRWERLAPGPVTSEAGLPLPESALEAVRRVEHAAGVVVHAPFVAEGYLAVLGQRAAPGCIEGTLEADGEPAEGAVVSVAGRSGANAPGGAFCVEAATGEAPVQASVDYAGLSYRLPPMARPVGAGRCASGTCVAAGVVAFTADALVSPAVCQVKGTVVDGQGAPVPQAEVVGFDDSVVGATVGTLCGRLRTRCTLAAASGDDGAFALALPFASRLQLAAGASPESEAGQARLWGATEVAECPSAPVTLRLARGLRPLTVEASFTGDVISWEPPRAASMLLVTDAEGLTKWEIQSPVGFTPPVTIGQLPAGAEEVTALTGAPVSEDVALVELLGTGRDGVQYEGVGSATRP